MADTASNIAWIRKYRPSSFEDYMGDNVKNLIMNRFKDPDDMPQTIMLHGTRGTGKTSMARLLSKEIHCQHKVDGHACGQCEMCRQITEYIESSEAGIDCPGIIEIDAATTTGKNDINDIIEDALIPGVWPVTKKVLILDECHMLSVSAQNSLLKVIEEPPEHLTFILCTTDPEKVIGTIHSRMQLKIEVKKKTVDELAKRLMEIAKLEQVGDVSMEALRIIAKKADRIPREAINLLETVAKNFGNVTVDNVLKALDDVGNQVYLKFFQASNDSLEAILMFNSYLHQKDIEVQKFVSGLCRFVLDCMYIKYGISLDDYDLEFVASAKQVFDIYSSNDLDTMLQVVESAARQMTTDGNRNELVLTTTALRIGKIKLLAMGLNKEESSATMENRKSLAAYQEQLKKARENAGAEIQTFEPNQKTFSDMFGNLGMKEVSQSNAEKLLPNTEGTQNPSTSTQNQTEAEDEFFDPTDLASMLADLKK